MAECCAAGRGERQGGTTGSGETSWEMVMAIQDGRSDGLEQDGGSGAECGQIIWGGDGGRRRRLGRSDDSDSDGRVDGAAFCCNPEGLG